MYEYVITFLLKVQLEDYVDNVVHDVPDTGTVWCSGAGGGSNALNKSMWYLSKKKQLFCL